MKLFFFTLVFLSIFKAAHGSAPDTIQVSKACTQVKMAQESATGLANYFYSVGNTESHSTYKKILSELSKSAHDLGCEGSVVRANSAALGHWQRCTSIQVQIDLIDDQLNTASVTAMKSGEYQDLSGIYAKRGKLAQDFLILGCNNLDL